MWRKLLFLITSHHMSQGDPWWPWTLLLIDFIGSKFEALLSLRRIQWKREILRLSLHATALTLVQRFYPEATWAISLSTLIHLSSPYTIPFVLLAATGTHTRPIPPIAILWPDMVDTIGSVLAT